MSHSYVVAFDDPVLRAWARYSLLAAGHTVQVVEDHAALLAALADDPAGVILGPVFERIPVAALLAAMQTAGCELLTVVVGAGGAAPRLWSRFGWIATLDGELDSRALVGALQSPSTPLALRVPLRQAQGQSAYSNSV